MFAPEQFMNEVEKVGKLLTPYEPLLSGPDLHNFKRLARNLNEALREEANKGKVLRIGIIGPVKAGKSTFLNALLFDGEEILPKAATPMTASLTKIGFSKDSFIKYVFYTREDWNIIEKEYEKVLGEISKEKRMREEEQLKLSKRDPHYKPIKLDDAMILRSLNFSDSQLACYELVSGQKQSGLRLDKYLDNEQCEEIGDPRDAAESLRQYIGSDGKYSCLVKYVEMGINNKFLHDLEIVDTPGLQDPIRSRSQETYRYMCQCDAVFLLCRASQFLQDSDIELFHRTLLDHGVKQKTLIATQLDLGAQNEVGKTSSYHEALDRSIKHVFGQAKKYDVPQEPITVCAMFDIIARKKEKGLPLTSEERHIEKNISHFEYGVPKTAEELRDIAHMRTVRNELEKYRREKDRIIQEHQETRARESRRGFLDMLDILLKGVDTDARLLKETDYASLQKMNASLLEVINNVNIPISEFFSDLEREVGQKFADLKNRLLANVKSFDELEVRESSHQEERSHKTGWWLWEKTHYTVVNVTTYTAELADGLKLLRNFAAKSEEDINATIKEILNKNEMKDKLKRLVLPVYKKFEGANIELALNEDMLIRPVNSIVQEFSIPEWYFDNNPYNEALQGEFSGNIENESISAFKTAFEIQMQNLCKDMRKKLDDQKNKIMDDLAKASVNFADEMRNRLEEQTSKLMDQMKSREESLRKYGEVRQVLEQCKKMLVE